MLDNNLPENIADETTDPIECQVATAESEPTAAEPAITNVAVAEPTEVADASDRADSTEAIDAKTDVAPVPAESGPKKFSMVAETFAELPLSEPVQQAVKLSGYETPTPVQAQIIPHILNGRDVLAQSQTGTGKTAAFALPILSRIETGHKRPQVLVLAPTRELAIQVSKSFAAYGKCMSRLSVAAIYGGQSYEPQLIQLRRGVDVIVGTPGRVIDHIKRGTLDISAIQCLVLDEADEMLNMGFLDDVKFVLKQTPAKRQIALFSATLPDAIREIAEEYLDRPKKITIKKKTMTAESINHRALIVAVREKVDVLLRVLQAETTEGVIVFTKTKIATLELADKLIRHGLSASALNGDMAQRARERTVDQFKSGRLNILVATDVAARGLDVDRVSHVINYDLPHDSESYVHRVGRTGRAGRTGEAIIFVTGSQRGKLRLIERVTKQPIEIVDPPSTDAINEKRKREFHEQLTETIENNDLSMFQGLIGKYAEKTGQPLDLVAAALAHLGQRGVPFLMKDMPKGRKKPSQRPGKHEREERRGGGDRGSRGERPMQSGMKRFRIEVGRKDGAKPGNIVGAIANEAGITGDSIGAIQIHDRYSTIDLPEGMPSETFKMLQHTKVAGKQLRLRDANGDDGAREGYWHKNKPGSFKKSKGNSGGRKGSGAKSGGKKIFVKGKKSSGKFKKKANANK